MKTIEEYIERGDDRARISPLLLDVEPELRDASKAYLASRKDEVPQLVQFVADHEFEQLRVLAHNMKGTGTSFGFPHLTRLGGVIEIAAKEGNAAVLSEQLLELSQYVQAAEEALSQIAA